MKALEKEKEVPHRNKERHPQSLKSIQRKHRRWLTSNQFQEFINMKADRKKWESSHRTLFLSIGFSLSLLLVNIAFSWKSPVTSSVLDLTAELHTVNELIEIPISKQPPPPPPKKALDLFVIKEVEEEIIEEINVNIDVEVNDESEITEIIFEVHEEEKVDEVFTIVETKPEPVGGMKAFYEYVGENLRYPNAAIRMGLSGRVFVEFIVEKDGSLTDLKVVKGIGGGCDEEAVRVLADAPKWNPGKQRGQRVRVHMVLPIRFVISEG